MFISSSLGSSLSAASMDDIEENELRTERKHRVVEVVDAGDFASSMVRKRPFRVY